VSGQSRGETTARKSDVHKTAKYRTNAHDYEGGRNMRREKEGLPNGRWNQEVCVNHWAGMVSSRRGEEEAVGS